MANQKAVSAIFESHFSNIAGCIKRARVERDSIKRAKRAITPLLMLIGFDDNRNNSVAMDYDQYSDRIVLRLYMYDAESFKCDEVTARLWALENWPGLKNQGTNDYASSLNRTYHFQYEKLRVTLDVYVKADSLTCRKVIVGEETKVIPTYAIQCD